MEEIRIQKYLADCGVMSRRRAEVEIAEGAVKVNGHPAIIGQKIKPGKDFITYRGKTVLPAAKKVYIKLNKPRGYVSTMSDEKGRKCVADLVKNIPERVYPIGRLDLDSEGLLLMTNDGALANALMHPKSGVEKVYVVKVRIPPSDDQMKKLNQSMEIDGYTIRPCRVSCPDPLIPTKLRFILSEGRNRQIRKMCEQVGLEVTRLKRIAEGKIQLGMLRSGTWAELDGKVLASLLAMVKEMDLAPFESQAEHILYCQAAGVSFEEGAIGFKFFTEGEKLGLCQLKPVGDAIYVLSLSAIDQKISTQVLANLFADVVQFLYCLEFSSVVYPIQSREDTQIAEALGFDRISDTLFVFDFPSTEEKDESEEHCIHEGCDCHHTAH